MKRAHSGIGKANRRTQRTKRRRELFWRNVERYGLRENEWTSEQKKTGRKGGWRITRP